MSTTIYGATETNGLTDAQAYHAGTDYSTRVSLSDPDLVRIDRLRLISDPGYPFWDISYCNGVLRDGRRVRVVLDANRLPKRGLTRALVELAKDAGRYGKGLGLLDAVSTAQ